MRSSRELTASTSPGTQADLNAALQWVSERQAELHRELAGLTRVQSALLAALRGGTEEHGTVLARREGTLSPVEPTSPVPPAPDPHFFDFSGVDLTGCRNNRARIRRLAEASGGTIRLRDAVDAVYSAGGWTGKREHLRTNLGKLLREMGERIDRGVYRVI